MITLEQINISNDVVIAAEKYPESVLFMLDLIADDNCQSNADLQFVNVSLKKYKNLLLMLDIQDCKDLFITNAVCHYRGLIQINRYNQIDEYISNELAQRDIKELFEYYNSIKIEFAETE